MTIRVVGAGLGRTGTMSLKRALERLLGVPCYHMTEVFAHPEHVGAWQEAARGQMPDWGALLQGYGAAVDWPAAAFYRELAAAFPQAKVVLSRRDPEAWWRSASTTIFPAMASAEDDAWRRMIEDVLATRFTLALTDKDACIAAYERHVAEVRRTVPADRLVEWRPADGWRPLCDALGLPVPAEPFPHANTGDEFRSRHAHG